jgi:hypothetical protein
MNTYSTRILAALIILSIAVAESMAQSPAKAQPTGDNVVLTKLFQPIYPPLARQTRITGDVELTLEVRKDGSVESANPTSGHPLLKQAAVNSATQSLFVCQKCVQGTFWYHMIYSFQLIGADDCCTASAANSNAQQQNQPEPRVVQSANHVTVIERVTCNCDPLIDPFKVRSLKCLYLWKCGRPRLLIYE